MAERCKYFDEAEAYRVMINNRLKMLTNETLN